MKRVSLLGASAAAIAAAMLNGAGDVLGGAARGVHRVAAGTKRARQMVSVKTPHNRSKYVPHTVAKELERAKRCYMQHFHGEMDLYSPNLRSKPVVHQMSKHIYAARQVAKKFA